MMNTTVMETVFTYEEALPWIREYYDQYAKEKAQEAKYKKIIAKRKKEQARQQKVERFIYLLKAWWCVWLPMIVTSITGVEEVLTTELLFVPLAVCFIYEALRKRKSGKRTYTAEW